LIIVLCDNAGFAVIDRLQRNTGNVSFNNLIADCNLQVKPFAVDFAASAKIDQGRKRRRRGV
jgi:3D-(3,5/4)-trihydroxycyclohexane-1,2-dione acylhydrolase (decyclizing)